MYMTAHRTNPSTSLLSTMYSSSFNQDSRPRQYLDQNRLWPSPTPASAMGGWAMNRNYSDQSSASTQSRSSGDFYSPISTSSSMSHELNISKSPQYHDDAYSQDYNNYTPSSPGLESGLSSHNSSIKLTPSSLGWPPDTEFLRLYKLIVPKGKEPYLELLPGYQACYNRPQQVFLDPPSGPQKGVYPCQYPSGCQGKQFRRPADLERHYRHVHADADQKASFPCDYKPCIRSQDPFTRKDHYRDHLKDFHKEDVGTAKKPKNARDPKKWQAAQQAWLEERQIDPRWWRCRRCLQRLYVETHGYTCTTCNEECTKARVEAREQKRRESNEHQMHCPQQDMSMTFAQCTSCNGSMWIANGVFGEGSSVPCPICVPSGEMVYEDEAWEGDARFGTSYETDY
ncbi:hypothetical protein DSL72_006671 [Monilinia vaccinii-corymbosi]|uniref:C2H2-type domain-containing protein n=1 Tax=Monilinia vaccinii-corymbosi TaxID=61207 RepID=A0A8A3PN05_9HELO|nr:hypothetical protein DSL72_006671 [Monilinia vaccinii-corymbosi]